MGHLRRAACVVVITLAGIPGLAEPPVAWPAHVDSPTKRSAMPDERREDSGKASRRKLEAALAQERAYLSSGRPSPVVREAVPPVRMSQSGGEPSYAAPAVALLTLVVLAGLRLRAPRPKRFTTTRPPPSR